MRDQKGNILSLKEQLAQIRLARSKGIGPILFYRLLQRFGSAQCAIEAIPDLARKNGRRRFSLCTRQNAEAELELWDAAGATLIGVGDTAYPAALAHIPDPPPFFGAIGRLDLLEKTSLGIVGVRNASANGSLIAKTLARDLGANHLVIVSGLARGIDAAAHRGALPTGTVAVLGGGIDVVYPRQNAEAELELWDAAGATLIGVGDTAYPAALAHIPDPPPFFGAIGRLDLLEKTSLGIVGVRNASANGSLIAKTLARDLGANHLVIVSGLARGIDAAAHRGALPTGTVAVLGGGIDVVYPRQNRALYEAVAAEGVLISEMPPGTQPLARHFPRRNRIISGLSVGIVVVEAAVRSGSLITARLALEQGREVFAVPGSALDPRSRGTNELIRQGAVLTESAENVLRELPEPLPRQSNAAVTPPPSSPVLLPAPKTGSAPSKADAVNPEPKFVGSEGLGHELESILGPVPTPVDDIIRQLGVPAADLSMAMMELEMAGRLRRHPGNLISMTPGP